MVPWCRAPARRSGLLLVCLCLADSPDDVQRALAGSGRYPRPPESCARLLAVLDELELVDLALGERSCRVREGIRADLTRSKAYRASGERIAAIERALAAELPRQAPARAA